MLELCVVDETVVKDKRELLVLRAELLELRSRLELALVPRELALDDSDARIWSRAAFWPDSVVVRELVREVDSDPELVWEVVAGSELVRELL